MPYKITLDVIISEETTQPFIGIETISTMAWVSHQGQPKLATLDEGDHALTVFDRVKDFAHSLPRGPQYDATGKLPDPRPPTEEPGKIRAATETGGL